MLSLSKSETVVLFQIARGLSTYQIAKKLSKSKRTVDGTRSNLLTKFDCQSTVGLLAKALEYGFLDDSLSLFLHHDKIRQPQEYLTLAEGLVLHLIIGDRNRHEIKEELQITLKEVENYRRRINAKWSVDSPVDLVLKSVQKGSVELDRVQQVFTDEDKHELWQAIQRKIRAKKGRIFERKYTLRNEFPRYVRQSISLVQLHILRAHLEGKSRRRVAQECGIQQHNVPRYLYKIRKQLEVKTPWELIKSAISIGVLKIIYKDDWIIKLNDEERGVLLIYAQSPKWGSIHSTEGYSAAQMKEVLNSLLLRFKVDNYDALIVQALLYQEISPELL